MKPGAIHLLKAPGGVTLLNGHFNFNINRALYQRAMSLITYHQPSTVPNH
jgi:hypothetical protein